jgi:hypothetical protein
MLQQSNLRRVRFCDILWAVEISFCDSERDAISEFAKLSVWKARLLSDSGILGAVEARSIPRELKYFIP